MSIFKNMLNSGESLFRDTIFLSYDFQPKVLFARESEQQRFAVAIRPLLQGHNGRNVFVSGAPGIGKTTACRHVLRELEEESDEIYTIYVNCWKENTTYKIYYKICEELGFKFIANKKTSELFALIKAKVNKGGVVFVFDEIDKLEETDFLYTILEDIYRKSIFLITNYRDTYSQMDERIRSRLNPEFLMFRPYTQAEIVKILKQRRDYAFVQNCWDEESFLEIVEKCLDTNDIRTGLYLMKESGAIAEDKSSKKIGGEHVALAIKKVEDFHIKSKDNLEDELQVILSIIKDNNGSKIGDLYSMYKEMGSQISYKSFQRRISKLSEANYINTQKVSGKEGNTTLVNFANHKKLTDF